MRLFDYKFLPLVFCLALVGCSDNETSEVPNPEMMKTFRKLVSIRLYL